MVQKVNKLKLARLLLGMTQRQLSERLSLSIRHISKIENGHSQMERQTELAVEALLMKSNKYRDYKRMMHES